MIKHKKLGNNSKEQSILHINNKNIISIAKEAKDDFYGEIFDSEISKIFEDITVLDTIEISIPCPSYTIANNFACSLSNVLENKDLKPKIVFSQTLPIRDQDRWKYVLNNYSITSELIMRREIPSLKRLASLAYAKFSIHTALQKLPKDIHKDSLEDMKDVITGFKFK